MKDYFGIDLKRYSKPELSSIHAAVRYEILLYRLYIVWNFIFMCAGVIFVYVNSGWLTTYEMLWPLGILWGVSGLPFFLLKDQARRKFASRLPADDLAAPAPPVEVFKLLAGFALGSWATHVMLIAAFAKHFELVHYAKKLQQA